MTGRGENPTERGSPLTGFWAKAEAGPDPVGPLPYRRTATVTMLFFLLAQRGPLTAHRVLQRGRPLLPSWPSVPVCLRVDCFYYYYCKTSSSLSRNIHVNICCRSGQVWWLVVPF